MTTTGRRRKDVAGVYAPNYCLESGALTIVGDSSAAVVGVYEAALLCFAVVRWMPAAAVRVEPAGRPSRLLLGVWIRTVPSCVGTEQGDAGPAARDGLREGQQSRWLAGRQERIGRATFTENDEVCDLSSVLRVKAITRDEPALDGRENHPSLLLPQTGKHLSVRRLDHIGRSLSQQEAVLAHDGVLISVPVLVVAPAPQAGHNR